MRFPHIPGIRQTARRTEAHKGVTLIEFGVEFPQVLFGPGFRKIGVQRPQNAPAHGHEMRRKGDAHRGSGEQTQLLLHFGGMPVFQRLISPEAVIDFAERYAQQGLASGAARPGFTIGNHRIGGKQPSLGQRRQPQNDAGGITAGVAHQHVRRTSSRWSSGKPYTASAFNSARCCSWYHCS